MLKKNLLNYFLFFVVLLFFDNFIICYAEEKIQYNKNVTDAYICNYSIPVMGTKNGADNPFSQKNYSIALGYNFKKDVFYVYNHEVQVDGCWYTLIGQGGDGGLAARPEYCPDPTSNYEAIVDDYHIYFYGKSSNIETFKNFYKDRLKKEIDSQSMICPTANFVFCSTIPDNGSSKTNLYLETSGTCDESLYDGGFAISLDSSGIGKIKYKDNATDYASGIFTKTADVAKFTCEDIIGKDGQLKDMLKSGVTIVKVLIPIILIIMGSIDFVQAIFAQDDGAIKKSQSKFIRRLIIAVIIFLIPSILSAILDIAHSIWPTVINNDFKDFCGIL